MQFANINVGSSSWYANSSAAGQRIYMNGGKTNSKTHINWFAHAHYANLQRKKNINCAVECWRMFEYVDMKKAEKWWRKNKRVLKKGIMSVIRVTK